MIYFYKWNSKYFFSFTEYNCLKSITEEEAKENSEELYFLNKMDPLFSRKSYLISNPQLLFIVKEGVELLLKDKRDYSHKLPSWILEKIKKNLVISVNTAYPKWKDVLNTR